MRLTILIATLCFMPLAYADIPLQHTDNEADAALSDSAVDDCDCKVSVSKPLEAPRETPGLLTEDGGFRVNPDEWSLVGAARGLSLHRPIYIYPITHSPQYDGNEADFVFQISIKHRLFGTNTFFGYTQRSFWQIWDAANSRPFRDTNYNPEIFYRWRPGFDGWEEYGFDIGLEHESNGRSVERSRSWNRIYGAVFISRGRSLYYLKTWYRLPEDRKDGPDDPRGDDNPDIYRFYGYGELHFARQIGNQQQISGMFRANPATGKGAATLTYSVPNSSRTMFYSVRLWHGYGETLLDYNRSTTRILLGVMLSR
jgi:phospholipase A1